ncbi:hypothetical protein CEXT_765901 [Caerostris extrusa]|uniref:Uncharacterized protein n=1 Tax=Caerostris extrusa TaxID=172846 RepID=A0AAV4XD24_CAEEX|nr:hypothetical protein CEXT_765901 [Caerostris extrusa]
MTLSRPRKSWTRAITCWIRMRFSPDTKVDLFHAQYLVLFEELGMNTVHGWHSRRVHQSTGRIPEGHLVEGRRGRPLTGPSGCSREMALVTRSPNRHDDLDGRGHAA